METNKSKIDKIRKGSGTKKKAQGKNESDMQVLATIFENIEVSINISIIK